jgi:Leucine-rich repeat (LRR) protein
LSKIESNSFHRLIKLKKLNWSSNKINEIDSNGFQGLDNLEELTLSGNKLAKTDSRYIDFFKSPKKLRLT